MTEPISFEPDPFDVDAVAKRVRESYIDRVRAIRCMDHYDPGDDHQEVWEGVARLCLEHGFDPDDWVLAQIDGRRKLSPNLLLAPNALRRAQVRHSEDRFLRDSFHLESQLTRLYGQLALGQTAVDVLTCEDEPLTPEFRFCFAMRAGLPEVASMYREAARLQLRLNPGLRELMKSIAPVAFLEVLDDPGGTCSSDDSPRQGSGNDPSRRTET